MKNKLKEIFNIAGRNILITGASGFFGQYISKTFLEVGAKVILLDRSNKLLKQTDKYHKKFGESSVVSFQVDFFDSKKLKKTLKHIAKKYNIDVVINNAYDLTERTGFNTDYGRLENSAYSQWQSAFLAGIYWPVLTTQIIGKQLMDRKRGSIINVSSMYGVVAPNPDLYEGTKFLNPPTYSVVKAGIIGLTRYTASFWGKYGIRCNAVLPGPFSNTESESPNSVSKDDPFLKKVKNKTVIKRLGHPDDLRGLFIYLAYDASSYMTGANLIIDGGRTCW